MSVFRLVLFFFFFYKLNPLNMSSFNWRLYSVLDVDTDIWMSSHSCSLNLTLSPVDVSVSSALTVS